MARRAAIALLWLAIVAGSSRTAEPDRPKPPAAGQNPVVVHPLDGAELQSFDWGWIRWIINAKVEAGAPMTMGIVHVEANQTNPVHLHPNSDEYLYVLSGSCEHRVGDTWVALKTGDTIRIPQGAAHGIRTGKEPCRSMILYNTGNRQMVVVDESKK